MSDAATTPLVAMFKKKSRPATSRQRAKSPADSQSTSTSVASGSASEVVIPTRKSAANPLIQGTKRTFSQRDEDGPDVKWKASGSLEEFASKERELLESADAEYEAKKQKREEEDKEREDDGLYHGMAAYANKPLINKTSTREIPKAMRIGPQKSTSTIRTVTVVDYQPDVCKDYKETGYCGFGDTCKFLHDRGTYLQGWQLDKLAADPQRGDSESEEEEEEIPWACYICRKHYTDPIVTKCGHYFCSACAISRFAKTPKCAACGAPTAGIFNRADKVVNKMKKRKQEKEAKELAGSDDEGGHGKSKDLELEIEIPERRR